MGLELEDEWRRYPCGHIQAWLDELETCTNELQRGRQVVYEWDNIIFWEHLDTDSVDTPGESLFDQYIRGALHTDGESQQYPEPSVNPYKWKEAEQRHRLLFACSRFSNGGILKDLVQAWKDFDESTFLTHSKFALARLLPVVSFRGESDFLPNDSGFIYAPGIKLAKGQDEERVKLRNVVDDNRTRYPRDLKLQRPTIHLPKSVLSEPDTRGECRGCKPPADISKVLHWTSKELFSDVRLCRECNGRTISYYRERKVRGEGDFVLPSAPLVDSEMKAIGWLRKVGKAPEHLPTNHPYHSFSVNGVPFIDSPVFARREIWGLPRPYLHEPRGKQEPGWESWTKKQAFERKDIKRIKRPLSILFEITIKDEHGNPVKITHATEHRGPIVASNPKNIKPRKYPIDAPGNPKCRVSKGWGGVEARREIDWVQENGLRWWNWMGSNHIQARTKIRKLGWTLKEHKKGYVYYGHDKKLAKQERAVILLQEEENKVMSRELDKRIDTFIWVDDFTDSECSKRLLQRGVIIVSQGKYSEYLRPSTITSAFDVRIIGYPVQPRRWITPATQQEQDAFWNRRSIGVWPKPYDRPSLMRAA